MSDIETTEIDVDDIDADEYMEGSFLATAAVIGVGALLGFAAAKSYDKVKDVVQTKLAERRAHKILAAEEVIKDIKNKDK